MFFCLKKLEQKIQRRSQASSGLCFSSPPPRGGFCGCSCRPKDTTLELEASFLHPVFTLPAVYGEVETVILQWPQCSHNHSYSYIYCMHFMLTMHLHENRLAPSHLPRLTTTVGAPLPWSRRSTCVTNEGADTRGSAGAVQGERWDGRQTHLALRLGAVQISRCAQNWATTILLTISMTVTWEMGPKVKSRVMLGEYSCDYDYKGTM